MYNKLKNVIPHKIKIDNFQARLLEKNDTEILQKFFEHNNEFFLVSTDDGVQKNEAENTIKDAENNINEKFLIGVFENNVLSAFVELVKLANSSDSEIVKFIVDCDCRGKGLASRLLNSIEELLIFIGAQNIKTTIKEQNICVLEFFQKKNFQEIKKEKQLKNPDKFEIILSKKLEKKELTIEDKYFKNGKLTSFSSKPTEQLEIYKIMQGWFEKGKKYSEMELNNVIKSKIECRDHVTLRRDMVDNHLLKRSDDGKEYWI